MDSLFDQSALTDLAGRLVEAARKAGADAADAIAVKSISQSVTIRNGEVEESQRAESGDMGLRVFVGRRQAVVSTNDVAGDGAGALAERAVAMAHVALEDRFVGLADRALLAKNFPDLDLLDTRFPSVDRLQDLARTAESAALAIEGVTNSSGAEAAAGIGGMVLVTTDGFHGAYVGSQHNLHATAIAGAGTGMETDYDFTSAVHASDLEAPETVGRIAGERAVRKLNPRKVPSGKVPVLFDPRVAGSLIGHLAGAINGEAITRKTSFLQDKLGQQVFSKNIRIIDDPLRKRGQASRPFDGEGVAGRRLAIVDAGVVTTWLLDCSTARELGLQTTGHAHRGVSSSPSPGPTNLHLEAGPLSPDELMADIAEGFYVTELIGRGVNMVTGDYSRGASGFWIEKGKITYPVSEVTIAGHLNDVFRSLTPANDLKFRFATNAPTVRVEGLTVAGR